MLSNVDYVKEFSSKKLIENPLKSKVVFIFETCNKKLVDDVYTTIKNISDADSLSLQELND